MRRLTLREVNEHHGGTLPPDAVPRTDDYAEDATPSPRPNRRPRAERFATLNAFVDFALAGLTRAQTKVWLILFRDTKAATGSARTGQADIARRAGLTRRAVGATLAALKSRGLVRVVRRGRLGAGPSVYRVHPTGDA